MTKKRLMIIVIIILTWTLFQVFPYQWINTGYQVTEKAKVLAQTLNQTIEGTTIKITLKETVTDLNSVVLAGYVKGKEKIVALEIKQDLPNKPGFDEAKSPGTDLKWGQHGLWIGGTWWKPFGQQFVFSISHELDLTKPQYYLIFYTSVGEIIYHKVSINPKLRDAVKEATINRTVDLGGPEVTITKIKFGLTQTILEFKANYNGNQTEFILTDLTSGATFKNGSYSTWGGKKEYGGTGGFEKVVPLPTGPMKLTIIKKDSGIEKSINVLP